MKSKKKSAGAELAELIDGLTKLLTVVFCALRACDVITWKWYWVLSPMIISELIGLLALIVAGAAAIALVKADKE